MSVFGWGFCMRLNGSLSLTFLIIVTCYALYRGLSRLTFEIPPNVCSLVKNVRWFMPLSDSQLTNLSNNPLAYELMHVLSGDEPNSYPQYVGVPVLFVHGHRGGFSQIANFAVEMIDQWSTLHRVMKHNKDELQSLDIFTVNMSEDSSAFHGSMVELQAHYINVCIDVILGFYLSRHTSVIILAHSMGGMVVRTALTLQSYRQDSIRTFITLNSPHRMSPYQGDRSIHALYHQVNAFWQAYRSNPGVDCTDHVCRLSSQRLSSLVWLSLVTGQRDSLIRSDLGDPAGLLPETQTLFVYSTSVDGVWMSIDHDCVMWCSQLLKPLIRSVYQLVHLTGASTASVDERAAILRRWFVSETPARFQLIPKLPQPFMLPAVVSPKSSEVRIPVTFLFAPSTRLVLPYTETSTVTPYSSVVLAVSLSTLLKQLLSDPDPNSGVFETGLSPLNEIHFLSNVNPATATLKLCRRSLDDLHSRISITTPIKQDQVIDILFQRLSSRSINKLDTTSLELLWDESPCAPILVNNKEHTPYTTDLTNYLQSLPPTAIHFSDRQPPMHDLRHAHTLPPSWPTFAVRLALEPLLHNLRVTNPEFFSTTKSLEVTDDLVLLELRLQSRPATPASSRFTLQTSPLWRPCLIVDVVTKGHVVSSTAESSLAQFHESVLAPSAQILISHRVLTVIRLPSSVRTMTLHLEAQPSITNPVPSSVCAIANAYVRSDVDSQCSSYIPSMIYYQMETTGESGWLLDMSNASLSLFWPYRQRHPIDMERVRSGSAVTHSGIRIMGAAENIPESVALVLITDPSLVFSLTLSYDVVGAWAQYIRWHAVSILSAVLALLLFSVWLVHSQDSSGLRITQSRSLTSVLWIGWRWVLLAVFVFPVLIIVAGAIQLGSIWEEGGITAWQASDSTPDFVFTVLLYIIAVLMIVVLDTFLSLVCAIAAALDSRIARSLSREPLVNIDCEIGLESTPENVIRPLQPKNDVHELNSCALGMHDPSTSTNAHLITDTTFWVNLVTRTAVKSVWSLPASTASHPTMVCVLTLVFPLLITLRLAYRALSVLRVCFRLPSSSFDGTLPLTNESDVLLEYSSKPMIGMSGSLQLAADYGTHVDGFTRNVVIDPESTSCISMSRLVKFSIGLLRVMSWCLVLAIWALQPYIAVCVAAMACSLRLIAPRSTTSLIARRSNVRPDTLLRIQTLAFLLLALSRLPAISLLYRGRQWHWSLLDMNWIDLVELVAVLPIVCVGLRSTPRALSPINGRRTSLLSLALAAVLAVWTRVLTYRQTYIFSMWAWCLLMRFE